jgi:SAM-dependent methyltransferase
MMDSRTRELETKLLTEFYVNAIQHFEAMGKQADSLIVADFGCGNGYTLDVLSKVDGRPSFIGYEFSPDLRAIARERFSDGRVDIRPVDIRNHETIGPELIDIAITQRVIINLLNKDDQAIARNNLIQAASTDGIFVFIECFQSGLDNLNAARSEYELERIAPAHHNLYLADDFFEHDELIEYHDLLAENAENFLSTHYYVSRVLHELTLGGRPFVRNSHFVNFMSRSLLQNVGDFSPMRAKIFRRSKSCK